MKRCEQWFFLLWIAAVVLYPQAATTVSVSRDRQTLVQPSRPQTLPLLADVGSASSIKAEGKSHESPDRAVDLISPSADDILLAPPAQTMRFDRAEFSAGKTISGRLQPGRGPPQQA